MLREGIEAALIVGIVASYLDQTGRARWMPMVWIGILLAAALSLFVGAALQFISAEFPQKAQEFFEAVVGVIAVCVLISMVFWMRKVSRSIAGELRASVDSALASSKRQGYALVGMIFFAVAREGLESVFFLLATFQQSENAAAPLGALLGLVCAAVTGYAIYAGGVRLNLKPAPWTRAPTITRRKRTTRPSPAFTASNTVFTRRTARPTWARSPTS